MVYRDLDFGTLVVREDYGDKRLVFTIDGKPVIEVSNTPETVDINSVYGTLLESISLIVSRDVADLKNELKEAKRKLEDWENEFRRGH